MPHFAVFRLSELVEFSGASVRRLIFVLFFGLFTSTAWSAQPHINGVRIWAAPDHTRLVFDMDAPAEHKLFSLANPNRVVIDLKAMRLNATLPQPEKSDGLLRGMRSAQRNGTDLRVVLDLAQAVRPKSFLLAPNGQYGHRLVVDLYDLKSPTVEPVKATEPPVRSDKPREVVVAIDAGHGGEDPGAIGAAGTYEKTVMLALAKRLARLIDKEPGMRAHLVRSGDYYVSLRKRISSSRNARADLFLSLHADAFTNRKVNGASVYILSERGATSEMARMVAQRENASDLVGGVSLKDKGDMLSHVLLDLQRSVTLENSVKAADRTLKGLSKLGRLHKKQVEKAAFVVLKAPDIPSMLIETGYITNRTEERRLKDPAYQKKLANALMDGIRDYFSSNPPSGTRFAMVRHHTIKRGDTLSRIASQYRVSLQRLRVANNLNGDRLLVGQVLQIP